MANMSMNVRKDSMTMIGSPMSVKCFSGLAKENSYNIPFVTSDIIFFLLYTNTLKLCRNVFGLSSEDF